ncbi:patatin-like phospholipase family protein [Echinicola jeungdonensis]|uniref:patatin-like phospholipase family protein n=1 Tax=Echinicola jeungdonensis TaxID=709343 RepID=UPI0025B39AB7|nr:patatin-like phospholipase family protein [Echinicola jeungdonensis]MDN3670330.1 patatin-like phospholipase family protein [Echinicola jeungdonensis]
MDYLDFVAGTSTGGILSCGLLTPSDEDPQKPKFKVQEVVNLYHKHGKAIFHKSFWHEVRGLWGILDEKFPNKALRKALQKQFGEIKLSQLIKPCLITSYEINNRKAKFFTQHNANLSPSEDFLVKEVAQATSAAPTYFQVAMIKSAIGVNYPLIDGGVFANNPAMCAYAETRKLDFKNVKKPTSKDMYLLSLGTGSENETYSYSQAKNFGLAQWIKPLISIMMSGNSETVSHQLKWLFDAGNNKEGYVRLEPNYYMHPQKWMRLLGKI